SFAASKLSNQAPRIINSLIKPLLKDFSYGKDPGRTISELGITGNSYDDLAANIRTAKEKVGTELADTASLLSPQTELSVSKSLSNIDEAMTAAARNNDTTVLNRLQEVKQAITKVLLPVTDVETGRVSIFPARDRPVDKLSY